jgi:hypothetical protein
MYKRREGERVLFEMFVRYRNVMLGKILYKEYGTLYEVAAK